MNSAKDILDAREKRVEFQKNIIYKFRMPMVAMRANYPGIDKDNDLTRNIVKVMYGELCEKFGGKIGGEICYKNLEFTSEGPIVTMILNKEPLEIKKICVNLEDQHILGRCVDIDVYNVNGESISRTSMGLPMRKCFICNEVAHVCVRSRKHSEEEIIDFIEKRFKEYTEKCYE